MRNQLLDVQRIKLNRYEFALKEAILFLGKPLLSYEDWLNNVDGADPLAAVSAAVANAARAASSTVSSYSYGKPLDSTQNAPPKHARHASLSAASGTNSAQYKMQQQSTTQSALAGSGLPSNVNDPAKLAEQQQARQRAGATNNSNSSNSPSQPNPLENASSIESQCLECMRLAINFLQSAQKSIRSIDDGSYFSEMSSPRLVLAENESLALLAANDSNRDGDDIDQSRSGIPKRLNSTKVVTLVDEARTSASSLSNKPSGVGATAATAVSSKGQIPPVAPVVNPGSLLAAKRSTSVKKLSGEEETDDGDLSIAVLAPQQTAAPTSPKKAKCDTCRSLLIQIDHLNDQAREMQAKIAYLEAEYTKECNSKKRIARSKDILDQEIEELTSQLFDQANRLVSDKARQLDETETALKDLKIKQRNLAKKLQAREDDLKFLKKQIYDMQSTQMQSNNFTSHSRHPTGDTVSSLRVATASMDNTQQLSTGSPRSRQPSSEADRTHIYNYSYSIVAGFDMFESSIAVDGIIFKEFQEHIKTVMLVASQPGANQLGVAYSTTFMKRCIHEDADPCLFYGYLNPAIASSKSGAYGSGFPVALKKRLSEGVMRGHCEIKLVAAGLASQSNPTPSSTLANAATTTSGVPGPSSSSNTAPDPQSLAGPNSPSLQQSRSPTQGPTSIVPKERCSICTIVRDCEYAMKLAPVPSGTKEWMSLCRFCRDRITSVMDFFAYTMHMLQGSIGPGKQGATILSIFRQMMWLRRRMVLAKIGSCSVFETAISAITGPGGGGDWETDIKILS
eukprot:jgi/Hompol1/4738/HPOL_000495-RA